MERYTSDELMRTSSGANSYWLAKRKKHVEMALTCLRIWKNLVSEVTWALILKKISFATFGQAAQSLSAMVSQEVLDNH